MGQLSHQALQELLADHRDHPDIRPVAKAWQTISAPDQPERAASCYRQAIAFTERRLWDRLPEAEHLQRYQRLFREQEQLIALAGDDQRHSFLVVIPVADRPQQLTRCLDSLLQLCRLYGYGGEQDGLYRKVSVLIAEDSGREDSIRQNQEIGESFTRQGLRCRYFGIAEQLSLFEQLRNRRPEEFDSLLGHLDPAAFHHKGASNTRNLAYLKLNQLQHQEERLLFYFIDSDQTFRVALESGEDRWEGYGINYLDRIDQLFTDQRLAMLTGKVIGDPPVSPAVMTGNLLSDVNSLLSQMTRVPPATACRYHGSDPVESDQAAYHDMADLFGFDPADESYRYRCKLEGSHTHGDCLQEFAARLSGFFHGEHPTRSINFEPGPKERPLQPARTVYTGNYVFRPELLQQFIPFAALKLRMAGPVLGRLIRAQLGERFGSANLPMLHRRTLSETGQSEWRPGIQQRLDRVDLSGEFERQYYGDVMLFTVERLVDMGYPDKTVTAEQIDTLLKAVEEEMRARYLDKQAQVLRRLDRLSSLLENREQWWYLEQGFDAAEERLDDFTANVAHNFSHKAKAYRQIRDPDHRRERLAQLQAALVEYPQARGRWCRLLNEPLDMAVEQP